MAYPDEYLLNLVNPLVANLGATSGTVNLQFNRNTNFNSTVMTGDLTLALAGSGNIEGVQVVVPIDGNGTNNLILPANSAGWYDIKGVAFDNTKRNIYSFYFTGGYVLYSNNKIPLPVNAGIPVYNIQNISLIGSTSATFNVQVNKTGSVKWMLTTSATPPTKAQILAGTGAVGSNYGSTSVTVSITALIPLTALTALTSYYLYSYAIDFATNESVIQTAINFSTNSIVAQDTFTGANVSDIIGRLTPIGGFTWNGNGTGTLGIVSNILKLTSAGNTSQFDYFDPGKRNVDVTIVLSNPGTIGQSALRIAFTDGNNFIQIGEDCSIRQTVGGTPTVLVAGSSAGNWVIGDTIRVVLNGVNISIYRNGTLFGTSGGVSASLTGQNLGYFIYQDNISALSSITVS